MYSFCLCILFLCLHLLCCSCLCHWTSLSTTVAATPIRSRPPKRPPPKPLKPPKHPHTTNHIPRWNVNTILWWPPFKVYHFLPPSFHFLCLPLCRSNWLQTPIPLVSKIFRSQRSLVLCLVFVDIQDLAPSLAATGASEDTDSGCFGCTTKPLKLPSGCE